jgi:hypothetical protein
MIGDIDTSSDSGSSNIDLRNCMIGDIRATSDSGSISIRTRNINISSDTTWTVEVDAGGANLDIVQSTPMGADVTVNAVVDDRDLEVKFEGKTTSVRAKFTCTSGKDLTLSNGPGFKDPVGGTMESMNYDNMALAEFQFNLETTKKDIEVEAENL